MAFSSEMDWMDGWTARWFSFFYQLEGECKGRKIPRQDNPDKTRQPWTMDKKRHGLDWIGLFLVWTFLIEGKVGNISLR
jgi:hypothetical protein